MDSESKSNNPGTALFNKLEAANYLHTSERHVERLVESAAIGHCRIGRKIMFKKLDLDNYIASTSVAPKGAN
jgi:excisionase family DNA binding protein